MANEITSTVSFTAAKGGATQSSSNSKSFDMTQTDMGGYTGTLAAATTWYALTFPGATAPYRVVVKNLDTASVLTLANTAASTYPISQIAPGDCAYFTVPASGAVYIYGTVASAYEVKYCEL